MDAVVDVHAFTDAGERVSQIDLTREAGGFATDAEAAAYDAALDARQEATLY